MSNNDHKEEGLKSEEFFCREHLLQLRIAFDWILCGKYIAKIKKYSPYDGIVAWFPPGDENGFDSLFLRVGRFDFKQSHRTAEETLSIYSITEKCSSALLESENPLLIVYCEPDEMLLVFDYSKVKIGPSKFDGNVGLMNLDEILIGQFHFPLS